jgi:hypothetical protein
MTGRAMGACPYSTVLRESGRNFITHIKNASQADIGHEGGLVN